MNSWNKWRTGLAALSIASAVVPLYAQSLDVGDAGIPSYAIPIAVPPGVAGMQPNLSLLYSGSTFNSTAGVGWSIQGISVITRCGATMGTDEYSRSVKYSVDDKLCLDGQRLIQTGANGDWSAFPQSGDAAGGSGMVREFRTEKDSGVRVRAYGTAGAVAKNGPAYFKVWTKSGQVYEYGDNSNTAGNSRIAVPDSSQYGGVVTAWAVSRISDTVGNYIDFAYTQRDVAWGTGSVAGTPVSGHEWALSEVRYTGTSTAAPQNKVVFDYEDRPIRSGQQDRGEAYHLGTKNVNIWRLASVRTVVNAPTQAIAVKTYKLSYSISSFSGHSRLTSVQECAGDLSSTKCMPAATFGYTTPGGGEAFSANSTFAGLDISTTKLATADGKYGLILIDADGDGKMDILRWSETPSENTLYLSKGGGSFEVSSAFNIKDEKLKSSDLCYYTIPVDINGDGLVDLFRYSKSVSEGGAACTSAGDDIVYINNGDGSFQKKIYSGPTLTRKSGSIRLVGNPKTSAPTDEVVHNWSGGENFYIMDLDGNGIPDLVVTKSDSYTWSDPPVGGDLNPCSQKACTWLYKGHGDGTFDTVPQASLIGSIYTPLSGGPNSPKFISDVDGDGLMDVVGVPYYVGAAVRSTGNFSFEAMSGVAACDYPLEVNGDGRIDCIGLKQDRTAFELKVSTGSSQMVVAGFNIGAAGGPMMSAQTYQLVDALNDGRTDIVVLSDDPTKNKLYRGNGDGTFSQSTSFNLNTAASQLFKSDGSYAFVVGDFLGNGNSQILRLKQSALSATKGDEANTNQLYVPGWSVPGDMLSYVISPAGLKSTLAWASLTNSTGVYTNDRQNGEPASWPYVDLSIPMWVVKSLTQETGVGTSTVVSSYTYAGLKAAYDGRGSRGFRVVSRTAPGANGGKITSQTEYLQIYPYTGVAKETKSIIATTGQVVSDIQYVYCDMTAADAHFVPGQANMSAVDSYASVAGIDTPCTPKSKIQRPYLYQSTETASDLDGTELPTVITTNKYNNWGDVDTVTVARDGKALYGAGLAQSSTRITKNQYTANDISGDNWKLGRLTKSTQENSVSNSLSQVATATGSAANAAAVAGTGAAPSPITLPPPPISNAVLSTIVDLILQD